MVTEILTVDCVLEEREKSWNVQVGSAVPWLPKSMCERLSELEFEIPKWLHKKIAKVA